MIRGLVFPAQCHRARGQLVTFGMGEYITITRQSVLSVTMAPRGDDIEIAFALTAMDGSRRERCITPRGYLNLTPEIGFILVPRALSFTVRGNFDRLVVEFIKTADFARAPLGHPHTQQR